ncbi:MAG: DUF2442 domain-containing protein [Plectolyngbya sp. WJT66-NPBG17]|jgi:hypothetical protein|nr:DUF2442 domain-containing protein [Plectolyngbya sp. WJT66-NPBG17]MBW4524346.1 DUF2442 domain-containing protein [Phormidium tanganyikae FI6-MK23]
MDNLELNAALEAQLDRARDRAILADATEPRAVSAHYDRASGQIVIHLKDGSTFMFPHELGQGLSNASEEDLANIEITPSGIGLHWEALDVDLTVPSLLQGIYGTKAWMKQLRHKQTAA